jgi:hypothetical protein
LVVNRRPRQDTMVFELPEAVVDDGTDIDDWPESDVECDAPAEQDELVRELDYEWEQEQNRCFREADDEIQRQLEQEIDDAIQKELDERMEEQLNKYMQRQQQIEDDIESVLYMERILGFTEQRPALPVTVADVDATIQSIVKAYMANEKLKQIATTEGPPRA